MASRYDILQTSEDPNDPMHSEEDQHVGVASERSSVSIQQHEYQNFSVANDNLVDSAPQQKTKDVQTTVVPAHKAEMSQGRPVTVRAKCTCRRKPNNTLRRLCAESASGLALY
jgi:hypothetical protein